MTSTGKKLMRMMDSMIEIDILAALAHPFCSATHTAKRYREPEVIGRARSRPAGLPVAGERVQARVSGA